MLDRRGSDLAVRRRCRDATSRAAAPQHGGRDVVRSVELQKGKGFETAHDDPKRGLGTEPLQNLLENESCQDDVGLCDERGEAMGQAFVMPLASQRTRPHGSVDDDPHRRLRSAL